MAQNYFQPNMNMLQSISFSDGANYWYLAADDNNNIVCIEGGSISSTPDLSKLPDNQLWQFFKIAENAYVIANYGNGLLINLSSTSNDFELGTVNEQTPTICFVGTASSISMCVSNVNYAGVLRVRQNDSGPYYTYLDANYAAQWGITEVKENPHSPATEAVSSIEQPSFNNHVPPPVYPVSPELMGTFYIPYFMVYDPSTSSEQQKIQQSPYYVLRQYGQYKLASSLNNPSLNTVALIKEWQQGWSDTTSASFSGTIGVSIGGSIEANEIFVKETLSGQLNAQLGITLTKTTEQSESQMTEINISVPPNTNMAVYGLTTQFELYQSEGNFPIAAPPTPMSLENGFVVISDPAPEA